MSRSLILTAELLMLLCLLLCSISPAASWLLFFFFLRLTQLTLYHHSLLWRRGEQRHSLSHVNLNLDSDLPPTQH